MKRELYNLGDQEFGTFVNVLHQSLEKAELPYIFVGGTAIQAHILKRICNRERKTLTELLDSGFRLQDYIRSTDDVDLAVDSNIVSEQGDEGFRKKLYNALEDVNSFEGISPYEDHILKFPLYRKGMKRPVFDVSIDDETNPDEKIALNVGRATSDIQGIDSTYYNKFFNGGQIIEFPYNDSITISGRYINPTDLLASKISKFRAKDAMDMHNLVDIMRDDGEFIDLDKIRTTLGPKYSKNYHRFLELAQLEDYKV
jgi:hypothetical protein|tara:strand:- start:25 stop:792 length:768 start_codon:yes stop_codon:yes gene_type:complete